MPGKWYFSLRKSTSGVIMPKSSATKSMLGKASLMAAISASPGAKTHCPFIAVSSVAGTSHAASKPLKWSIRTISNNPFCAAIRDTHQAKPSVAIASQS